MTKTKKSKKQNQSSKKSLTFKHTPGEHVSFKGLKEAMIEALLEEDLDTFKGCVAILIEKLDYKVIQKNTGLSKTTLYRMCESTSNPTLENISKILSFTNKIESKKAA